MLPIPSLYLKLAAGAAVLAVLGFHFYGDHQTAKALEQARSDISILTEQKRVLQEQLITVTGDKKALDKRLTEADLERQKVRADLNVTLKKLRAQKPPTECKAAVEWAIENKGDLAW